MSDAAEYYSKGLEFKKSGDVDSALTEFRRAVLADPQFFDAQMDVGRICRQKANLDPIYLRNAFEAYRAAARMNLQHEEAHDGYILMAQKTGRLADLMSEYDGWMKADPSNEFLKRCHKNILTISMAMMPDKVNISHAGMSGSMSKMMLFGCLGLILTGFGLMILPAMSKGAGIKHMAVISSTFILFGIVGLLFRSRLK